MSTIATQRPAMDVALGALSALARLGVHTKLEQLDTGLLGLATPLTHEMELQLAVHARAFAPAAGLHLVFTAHAFEDQWFSHQHAGRGVTVVSTAAAERARDVSLAAFVAYEVLLHALSLASPYYDMPTLLHEEERGCLFDLCREHARLPFKLDAMGLCGSCRTQLDHWHIDVGVVDLLAGAVAGLQRQASVSLT